MSINFDLASFERRYLYLHSYIIQEKYLFHENRYTEETIVTKINEKATRYS